MSSYPAGAAARDRFVLDRRPPRARHDPWRSQGTALEDERAADGTIARVLTVFLTGRECPWRCVMCDLWQHTTETATPPGAIAAQIAAARWAEAGGESAGVLKLYNAGSFFDARAVPEADYDAIAGTLAGLSRVIVESHPSLIGARTDRWVDALDRHRSARSDGPALEVAMGLETVHPGALERLHKRMTVDQFGNAAAGLRRRGIDIRVFLLVSPPFVPADEQHDWLRRSVESARSCGASVISLIPTRTGNGAIDALAREGLFRAPRLIDLERGIEAALTDAGNSGTRIFADLWDLQRVSDCPRCLEARRTRLQAMNLDQRVLPRIPCEWCGAR